MFNIQKYLEKFSKNINSIELYKKEIIEVIKKNTQIKLSLEDFEIRDCVINFKGSPAVKNKIFIYKNKILEDIKTSIPGKIVDIK